jgi:hypothetical protein
MDKFNQIKDIAEYYENIQPFYKELCLDIKSPSDGLDIFPYYTKKECMLGINLENTYTKYIIDNIHDLSEVKNILDDLIDKKITILPFIFDYNIDCHPRAWNGDNGFNHPLFSEGYNNNTYKDTYQFKYIIYYIIKHFDIDKWPHPIIFYNFICKSNLFYFIKNIDEKSLNLCINKVIKSYNLLNIYNRDIYLDEYEIFEDITEFYIDSWQEML